MGPDEAIKIVCSRVDAKPSLPAGSSKVACSSCGAECWITSASEAVRKKASCVVVIVCGRCFGEQPIGPDEKLMLTAEQLRDVGAELARRRRTSAERN